MNSIAFDEMDCFNLKMKISFVYNLWSWSMVHKDLRPRSFFFPFRLAQLFFFFG